MKNEESRFAQNEEFSLMMHPRQKRGCATILHSSLKFK